MQLASGIYNFACSLWNHHTDTFLQHVSSGNEAAVLSSLERTLLSLKGTVELDLLTFEISCPAQFPSSCSGQISFSVVLEKMVAFLCMTRTRVLFVW